MPRYALEHRAVIDRFTALSSGNCSVIIQSSIDVGAVFECPWPAVTMCVIQ